MAKASKKAASKKVAPSPRNTPKKEAEASAEKVDDINELKELIVKEICLVAKGQRVDIQNALAYAKKLMQRKDPLG